MRLCRFTVASLAAEPVILPKGATKNRLSVGVQREHWNAVVAHLTTSLVDEAHPALHQVTESVEQNGIRYTYLCPTSTAAEQREGEGGWEKGSDAPTVIESVKKTRLYVEDIKMPRQSYDLRFSVSVEDPTEQSKAAAPPPPPLPVSRDPTRQSGGGYGRRKARTSFVDGLYRYDCTEVVDSRGQQTYEVEIEGVFADTRTELTLAWVEGLLRRAAALAALHP